MAFGSLRAALVNGVICPLMVLCSLSVTTGQEPAKADASVEEMVAMLQAIAPYRPTEIASGKIELFGSTSMDAMAHGWATGFKNFHPGIDVEISAAGSESAFEKIVNNPESLAMFSRPVRAEELAELRNAGLKDPVAISVAKEALGVFVHKNNPVNAITGEQLRKVFTEGTVPTEPITWKLLGATGPWGDRPIHVISRTESSGTQVFLRDFIFHASTLRAGVSDHRSNAQVVDAIETDELGIAICGLKCGETSSKALQLVAGGQYVPSDDHAVITGRYPLTRPLTIVLDRGQTGAESLANREFLKYILAQAGQTQAILSGFFPLDGPLLQAGLEKVRDNPLR